MTIILAFLILILFAVIFVAAVANESPGKIIGILAVFTIIMATPWAFWTVVHWFVGGAASGTVT